MFKRFMPKEIGFFNYFEAHVELSIEACRELLKLVSTGGDTAACYARIKELEHKADDVIHHCLDALHRTFITPFDRPDIQHLIHRLDDIIDGVDAVASRMLLYEIKEFRPEVKEVAEILVRATTLLDTAVRGLRNPKHDEIHAICVEIHQCENQADEVLRGALGRLFRETTDPITVIKWNELFQILEKAVDRCEDAADVIEGVVIEAS